MVSVARGLTDAVGKPPGQIAPPDADIDATEIAPFASQRRCRCRQRRPGSGRSV